MTQPREPRRYRLEDLEVGMTSSFAKMVTEEDIVRFAEVSGDANPIHLNEAYAKETPFGGRIAHGLLSAGYISAVLGNQLPGPGSVYLGQDLRFKAPVRIGDTVEARVEVIELIPEKKRVVLKTECSVGETVVIEGQATLLVPSRT